MKFLKNFSFVLLKSFVIASIVASFITFIIAGTVNARVGDVKIEKEKLAIEPKPTKIYDVYGNKLAEFEINRKEMTTYDEIPVEMIEAVVAIEDREFFEHSGINVQAIFRAILIDIKAGAFVQGGSTLTQQLIKTIYLDPGKTLERKQEEAIYATALEQVRSKKEILAYYLNHIFYGNRAYGVKRAIDTYYGQTIEDFKKDDEATRVAKAALLIGIPNAPSVFNPYADAEKSMQRRNTVLTAMYTEGYITKEVYDEAKKKPFMVLKEPKMFGEDEKVQYPEYVHYVLDEASKILDISIEEAMYSGMKIYTSFNPDVYEAMRKHMANGNLYPSDASDGVKVQGAAVYLNPQNGEIYAMTGSRDEIKEFLTFNRAFQAKRQPGSAFKPLIAYGPALESGKFTPYSSVSCSGSWGGYSPKDHGCGGSKTMAEALRVSNNVPAVWVLDKVGIDYARKYVKNLGITLTDNDVYLPIALGGIEKGITPFEMADAYQAYANGGKRAPAHTIRRLVNTVDEVIYEPEAPKQVIKEASANQMKNMLRSVVTSGTGRNAIISGYDIAGKTGTNENAAGAGNNDIWFAGFTSNMVGVVWMGFDHSDASHYIRSGQTSYITAKMWAEISQDVLKILPQVKEDKEIEQNLNIEVYHSKDASNVEVKWSKEKGIKYEIYKDGVPVSDTKEGSFKDVNVKQGESYTYKVVGYDTETGKKIKVSNSVTIKLPIIEKETEEEPKKEEPKKEEPKKEEPKKEEPKKEEPKKEEPKKEEPKKEEPATPPATSEPSTEQPANPPPANGDGTTDPATGNGG